MIILEQNILFVNTVGISNAPLRMYAYFHFNLIRLSCTIKFKILNSFSPRKTGRRRRRADNEHHVPLPEPKKMVVNSFYCLSEQSVF